MTKLFAITGKPISGEWGTDAEEGNGIPVLRTTNFTNTGKIDYSNVVMRNINKNDLTNKYLKKGDIILEKSGGSDKQPVGRVVYFDGPDDTYLFNNFTGLLRVKEQKEWLPKYVFWALYASYKQGKTRQFENKTTGLHNLQSDAFVKKTDIKQVDFCKQIEISAILDKLRCQIETRKNEINELDVLVKARFVEMFEGNNYAKRTLEEVCINIVDCPHSTPKYEGELLYPAIRTTEIKSGYIDWSTMKYVSKDEYIKRTSRLVPEPGDIVYGREGTYGNAVVLPPDIKFCLGQRVMLFRPNTQVCLSEYLLYSILSDSVKQQADAKNVGATVPHVNVADAKKFKILVPPIIKQNEFVYFVHQVDKSKVA